MLEKMSNFFERRSDTYDDHMMTNIESAREFYPYTASCLPCHDNCRILDLGCGTGLELESYFALCPNAEVCGIDLSDGMLKLLKEKFTDKNIHLIHGSYFDISFGTRKYDAAVSVESLHHFTKEEKIPLYTKLHTSLVDGGYFILTDYFALTDEEEKLNFIRFRELKEAQGICDDDFYHFDTPLTAQHECEALIEAGFSDVQVLKNWGATYTIKAVK